MPLKTRHFLYVFVCVGDGGGGGRFGGGLGVEGRVYICEFSAVFLFWDVKVYIVSVDILGAVHVFISGLCLCECDCVAQLHHVGVYIFIF